MNLAELIEHYTHNPYPPAGSTLLAPQRFARVERCRWAVQYKGKTIAAFRLRQRAEQFAASGRIDTPDPAAIVVVDLHDDVQFVTPTPEPKR
jgi:hypothetical protein